MNENTTLYENWIYKINATNDKMYKYFLTVNDSDIFYYSDQDKSNLLGMHNLTGCFIKENGQITINNILFYIFEIQFPTKKRQFYSPDKKIITEFVKYIMQGVGYLNFYDFYELNEEIGKGKFGIVKSGVNKKSKQKVAVKIINKNEMGKKEYESVKMEIEIMKICHHPNIVQLFDYFENSDFIFIVMEFISGLALIDYLETKNNNLPEKKVASLMFQLGKGLQYLHQFGIVHRDLKLANIMITTKEELKIMDFGLSIIISPNEKSADGCGTLIFVAPEVLTRKPYNGEIDIWSMGVILFHMLFGIFPFDDDNDDEQKIAKQIVFDPLDFPKKMKEKVSKEVIDLILKCLEKESENRITINDYLSHKWFKINGLE